MDMYIDIDCRKRYILQDLTLGELHALRRAIGRADLPDRRTLHRLSKHLGELPKEDTTI